MTPVDFTAFVTNSDMTSSAGSMSRFSPTVASV
jgi:hypothetical protein